MVDSWSLPPLVAAGVDVDGDEGLGFVDDDVAAALQMHLAGEGVLQLSRDVEAVEDRLVIRCRASPCRLERLEILRDHFAHAVVGFWAVHDDALDVLGEEVAHGALDQVGLLEDASGGRLAF